MMDERKNSFTQNIEFNRLDNTHHNSLNHDAMQSFAQTCRHDITAHHDESGKRDKNQSKL